MEHIRHGAYTSPQDRPPDNTIAMEMGEIESAAVAVGKAIDELEQKAGSFLRPPIPEPADVNKAAQLVAHRSPIADRLYSLRRHINKLGDRVAHVTSRIDE